MVVRREVRKVIMPRTTIRLVGLVLGVVLLTAASDAVAKEKTAGPKVKPQPLDLRLSLRDLWIGHIFWGRNVVLSTTYGDATAAKLAEERVVQNARDIAASTEPYYGKEASDKLFGLLVGHDGAIKEYMSATFEGKKEAREAAVEKMKKNADDIATFLSSANPNWKKETLLSALLAHGGHHMAQIDAINAKDFSSEANTWAAMKSHIYVIADVLADGMVRQFPMKFGR